MKSTRVASFLVGLVALSLACSFATKTLFGGEGPGNFSAQSTSPTSVALTWSPVEGARGYRVLEEVGELGYLPIADLGADRTMYEDLMAPPDSTLKYRVQTITSSGAGRGSDATVTTAASQPNPLEVQAEFDPARAATETIGIDGGSVSVEDRDGTLYQLEIPAGVLGHEVEFTLTPIGGMGGWPLDGDFVGGVRIEPEDLALYDMATLSISLTAELPKDGLVPIGIAFDGTGQEFHLQPIDVQSTTTGAEPDGGTHLARPARQYKEIVVVPVRRTGSHGVGKASPQKAAEISRGNPPTGAGARAQQQQAAQSVSEEGLAPYPGVVHLWNSLPNVFKQISDAKDCRDMSNAMGAVNGWLEKAGKIAAVEDSGVDAAQVGRGHDLMMHDLAEKIGEITGKTAKECKQSKGKSAPGSGCAAELIGNILHSTLPFFQDLQKQVMKDLGKDFLQLTDGDLKSCQAWSYQASGGSDIIFEGTICDVTQPFSLGGIRPNGTLLFDFSPTSEDSLSGTWTYVNPESGGGCTEGGSGTYSVLLRDGAGQVTVQGPASLICEDVNAQLSVSDTFDLTSIEPCGR